MSDSVFEFVFSLRPPAGGREVTVSVFAGNILEARAKRIKAVGGRNVGSIQSVREVRE